MVGHTITPPTDVPLPAEPFEALSHKLPTGSLIFRVHSDKYAGNEFNPGKGSTRFAHFKSLGNIVPSLYGAETINAAICETLLHDVPLAGGLLTLDDYAHKTMTAIKTQRELNLAMLMGPGLRALGLTQQDITATNGNVYSKTVLWAEAAHKAGFDGLVWMSARENTAEAYVFFGDRVKENDFSLTGHGLGSFTPLTNGFSHLYHFCSLVNVQILTV